MCQTAQEQGDTYQGITTIVALWIDDSTIALATDDSMNILHLGGHVDLTYRSSSIDTAMLLGHVTERTGRRQVAYGVARSLAEHIVGNAYQGIFLAKHLAVLADERQAIDIRIDYDTHVITTLLQLIHDTTQVLLQWLWVVSEVTIRLTIEELVLYAERIEQLRKDDTTHRVDRIHAHLEVSILDSLHIH